MGLKQSVYTFGWMVYFHSISIVIMLISMTILGAIGAFPFFDVHNNHQLRYSLSLIF